MPIPGLGDRKAMEEERLARVAASRKRERSISPPVRSPRKAPKLEIEEQTVAMDSGARLKLFSAAVAKDQQSRKPAAANATNDRMKATATPQTATPRSDDLQPSSQPQNGALKYALGVVKKTWAFGHQRDGNDIKLEEVLEPSSVRTAVLSAFQWDPDWVMSKLKTPLNGGSTKCVFVMQAKTPDERTRHREWTTGNETWLRVCLPPMDGVVWCMHSKLMLLFHKEKLRIAVPTANLLNFDWGETGHMENNVFLIDLPRLPEGVTQKAEDLTFFGQELLFFVGKQQLDRDVLDGVLKFDFKATEGMAFIHTIGGMIYERHGAERTGLLGLSRAIQHLNLAIPPKELEIDFAASSIGQLNDSQLLDLHAAAAGQDLIAQAAETRSKAASSFFTKTSSKAGPSSSTSFDIKSKLRIYFPTEETVQASTAGAAGTICLQRKYFEGKTFPRSVFRDYKSTRQGLLSHNKILCARGKDRAWVYVGSANMSKSAWGELPKDRKEKRITCRNWECGVLLPVAKEKLPKARQKRVRTHANGDDSETESEDDGTKDVSEINNADDSVVGMDVFEGVVKLPFQYPGELYHGREPWYFTEKH